MLVQRRRTRETAPLAALAQMRRRNAPLRNEEAGKAPPLNAGEGGRRGRRRRGGCETLAVFGPPGLAQNDPREVQTHNLKSLWSQPAATIRREDPPRAKSKARMGTGGEKRREIFGSTPLGHPHPLGAPPFGPAPFWPLPHHFFWVWAPPFWASTLLPPLHAPDPCPGTPFPPPPPN